MHVHISQITYQREALKKQSIAMLMGYFESDMIHPDVAPNTLYEDVLSKFTWHRTWDVVAQRRCKICGCWACSVNPPKTGVIY